MKQLKEVIEVENEGLISLLNENILVMCGNYFYYGKLIGVNDTCIKIEKCHQVFETGAFTDKTFKDKQFIAEVWYVQLNSIESFGKSPKN